MNYPNRYYEVSSTSAPGPLREHSKPFSEEFLPTPYKREQAREKQHRKRQDSASFAMTLNPGGTSDANMDSQDQGLGSAASLVTKRKGGGKRASLDNLPLEEAQRKQRIREAARERQRKHRAGVKARRMAELGMAIVNEGGGIEQTAIGYTINEQGQYEAVLADPSNPNQLRPFPIPQAHATPGQIFASTLLLGLCWTPNLKHQLLRSLRLTNEDLATFEPFIVAAFNHWDNGRSMHFAARGRQIPPPHIPAQSAPHAQPYPSANDRFQRPLMVAFPTDSPHGRHQSLSPSEGTHHADGESDAQIKLDDSRQRNVSSGLGRGSGEVAAPHTNGVWREHEVSRNTNHEEGRSIQAFESTKTL